MFATDLAKVAGGADARDLTPLRREVLGILRSARGPLKAYQLIAILPERRGASVKPPTIYRTLEHLVANGLAHRIESLGAYAACMHAVAGTGHVFLICERCGGVREIESHQARLVLDEAAREQKFALHQASIELRGACGSCARENANPA